MSILAEAFAASLDFEHDGRHYTCRLIDQGVKLEFERRLFARAKAAAKELKDCMTHEEYLEHLQALNNNYLRGDYAFESDLGVQAVNTISGFKMLVSLMLNVTEEEALKLAIEAKDELSQVVRLAITQSFPALEKTAGKAADTASPSEKKS